MTEPMSQSLLNHTFSFWQTTKQKFHQFVHRPEPCDPLLDRRVDGRSSPPSIPSASEVDTSLPNPIVNVIVDMKVNSSELSEVTIDRAIWDEEILALFPTLSRLLSDDADIQPELLPSHHPSEAFVFTSILLTSTDSISPLSMVSRYLVSLLPT
eukprot:TRINITY_DN6959_c0_g2_i4.p1 TRINITY_DN6959_c0_g2~~TRINITY_DN6959_c0_g2_i4.p1  ORF type:complete len:170 (-),score=34.07 TRINITY_DN6959_c0_g2_i4:390-851(-)